MESITSWASGTTAPLHLVRSAVRGNEADHAGGDIGNEGVLVLVRSVVERNRAAPDETGGGGGILNERTPRATGGQE